MRVVLLAAVLCAAAAFAEEDLSYLTPDMVEIKQHYEKAVNVDSGLLALPEQASAEMMVLFETTLRAPGSTWMKLEFDQTTQLGYGREAGPFLRITSEKDGAVQYLDMISIQEWYFTSAYFNGDAVRVELVGRPTGEIEAARVKVIGATVGDDEPVADTESICDGRDDRIYSPEQTKAARYIGSGGCSGWIFNDEYNCFGTAGHCGRNAQGSGTMQFNVPLSSTTGAIQHPPPEEQFSVDRDSIQMVNGGVGNDWGYLGTFLNSNTGRSAFQHVNGNIYTLGRASPPTSRDISIHIAGHGTCETAFPQGACRSRQYSQVNKNDTHTGGYTMTGTTLRYRTDTTGGNSGSGVEVVHNFAEGPSRWTFEAIGIHTHGGCTSSGGSNAGTALQNAGWTAARNNPRGVCQTGAFNTRLRRSKLARRS